MKKIIIIVTGVLFFVNEVVAQNSFVVNGNIEGLKNDSVIFFIKKFNKTNNTVKADTIITKAKNGTFQLEGAMPSPTMVYTVIGGLRSRKNFSFYLEKGQIEIKGSVDSLEQTSITGSPNNEDYTAHRDVENKIYNSVKLLQQEIKDKAANDKELERKLTTEIYKLRDSVKRVRYAFIKSHPHSFASSIYLYVLQDNIPVDQLESLYTAFSDEIKDSEYGYIIREKIVARKRTAIGNIAPDFASTDTSGRMVGLKEYKGKYVLLDFWASWCVPCRQENPYLIEAYKKFKDKGFTIVSISLDDNAQKWKMAIVQDKLVWTHLSDLNAFNNKVAKLYGVQPIPDNFLISPDGKIIERGLRGEDLEKKLKQILN